MRRDEDRKRKYFALMERYNQLGHLLPAPDDLDTDDAAAIAEVALILAEMEETQAKMEALSKRPAAVTFPSAATRRLCHAFNRTASAD